MSTHTQSFKTESELRLEIAAAEFNIIDTKERLKKMIMSLAGELPVSKLIEVIQQASASN